MNKLLLLSSMIAPAFYLNAQTVSNNVIASDGGYAQTLQGSIAWTSGEAVSETYNAVSNITTMGFLQPEADLATLIKEQGDDKQILVFPNPVKDELSVNFSGVAKGRYAFELVDERGRLIYKSDIDISETNNRTTIKVSDVAAGAYLLRVNGKDFNKAIKINKVY